VDFEALRNLWVVFLVTAASVTDVRFGKVYNVVTIPTMVAGLTLNGLASGWPGVALGLQGLGIGLALLLTTLLFGQYMGGGDIKLIAALGALCGPSFLVVVLAVALPLGGLMAVAVALAHGRLRESLRRLGWWLRSRLVFGISESPEMGSSLRFPYALAIAGGALAALWWRS